MILWINRWKFEGNENAYCPFELRIDANEEHYYAPATEAEAEDTYSFDSTRKKAMDAMRVIETYAFSAELPYRNNGFIELWRLEVSNTCSDMVALANDHASHFGIFKERFGASTLNLLASWQYSYDEVTRHPAGRTSCDVYHRKVIRSSTTMKEIGLARIAELSKETTARIDANTSDPGAIVRAAREAVAKLNKEKENA